MALDVSHDGRERRYGPATQVIAVTETAGNENQISVFRQPDLLVPDRARVPAHHGPASVQGVVIAVGAGENEDAKFHRCSSFQRLRAGQRDQAIQDLKASLLLEKVADEEKVDVSDEEMDHEVEALAQQSKQTVEAVRARLTRDGGLDRIRTRIRNEKTIDLLYRQSA